MVILTTFPDKVFSSMVPDIEMSSDKTRIHFSVTFDGENIHHGFLYPDADGKITFGGISELVQPFARRKLVASLVIALEEQELTTDADGSQKVTTTVTNNVQTSVVYCTADVNVSAKAFCDMHFLTRLLGDKMTAFGRLEVLHYDSTEDAIVTARYADGSTAQLLAGRIAGDDNYSTVDVSPDLFTEDGKNLYAYDVVAGNRHQRFRIDFSDNNPDPALLFTNSFGCQETAYCVGTLSVNPELKYSSILIGNEFVNYDIDEKRVLSADTGPLTPDMAKWMTDLFRSDEVYLLRHSPNGLIPGKRIILQSNNSKTSNDTGVINRFTFTYILAQKNQNIIDVYSAGRIFDMTFDNTFE